MAKHQLQLRVGQQHTHFKWIVLLLAALVNLAGCKSAPTNHVTQQIIPREKELQFASQLDKNLDNAYGAWKSKEAEKILNGILKRLVAADPTYEKELTSPRVHLLHTSVPLYAPGLDQIIYISRGVLSTVAYENELAGILATQLTLLKEHAARKNLAALQGQEFSETMVVLPTVPPMMQKDFVEKGWFDAGGLFDFGPDVYLKAESKGIALAYKAKFDPRGSITYLQRLIADSDVSHRKSGIGKILPELADRLKQAREDVAKLSPLRDPTVKSLTFDQLQSTLRTRKAKQ